MDSFWLMRIESQYPFDEGAMRGIKSYSRSFGALALGKGCGTLS